MAKLSVLDVAKRLGKSPQGIRDEIKTGVYPFAVAVRPADNVGWDYTIFPEKFEEYCRGGWISNSSAQEENKPDFTTGLIDPPKMLTVKEVAKRLGKSPQTICKYIEAGLYPFAEAQKLYGRTQYAIFSKEFEEYCGAENDAGIKLEKKITVTEVAKRLGKDPNTVRKYIEAGLYPFAESYEVLGSKRLHYTIFSSEFEAYCGLLDAEIKKITVTEAAKRLGKSSEAVRKYIVAGLYPFAVAYKLPDSSMWDYTIFPAKFEEYCGTEQVRKITVTEAAKHMKKAPETIRKYIEAGKYPFAVAYKLPDSSMWDYTIFPAKFEEYYGPLGADIKKITPADVAKHFKYKEVWPIHLNIKIGLYPFAVAYKRPDNFNWNYTIFPKKFEEYCATGGKPNLWKLKKIEGKIIYSTGYRGPRPNEAILD